MAPRARTPASAPPAETGKLRTELQAEQTLRIEPLPLASLTPWAKNARTHSKKQIQQIADSITTFGFTNPVLVDGAGTVLAGHGRVEAARLLGMESVPCVRLEHMTAAQKQAYVIADNKLALNAGWDDELLGEELAALMGLEDLDFDLSVTGFTIAEMDGLVEGLSVEEPGNPADDVVPETAARRVQLGDVWQLGAHRLVCGDALDPQVVALLMSGPGGQDREQARMVFSDPPCNVPIDGHVVTKTKGAGAPKHPEFAMASGEMSRAEFTAFLTLAFQNMAEHAVDGSIHFLCMDWRHMGEMLEAGEAVYSELKNLVVWAKGQGGMGSFYRSRHELIFAFKKGTAPHVNSFELGQHGRYRTNVWEYHVASTARKGQPRRPLAAPDRQARADDRGRHQGRVRPRARSCWTCSGVGLHAHRGAQDGRRARLVELDPVYCDRILARWEAYAHDEAELLHREAPLEGSPPDGEAPTPERRSAGAAKGWPRSRGVVCGASSQGARQWRPAVHLDDDVTP
jgi:hypothetical protein